MVALKVNFISILLKVLTNKSIDQPVFTDKALTYSIVPLAGQLKL